MCVKNFKLMPVDFAFVIPQTLSKESRSTHTKWMRNKETEKKQKLLAITEISVSSWFCCLAHENVFQLGEMAEKTLPEIDQKP